MFDKDKAAAITEAIVNALRPVGVTVAEETVTFNLHGGEVSVMLVGLVRDSAGQISQQSVQDKQTLNQMLADQAEEQRKAQIDEIRRLTADPDALAAALFSEEEQCSHEQMHEGLCLNCGYTEDEDDNTSTG